MTLISVDAGLTGQVVDVPYAITAFMLIIQLQGTALQNRCAQPGVISIASFSSIAHWQTLQTLLAMCLCSAALAYC